jgi:hypothetical protein
VKKEKSAELEVEFKKLTHLAAELIRSFSAPAGVHVVVLFDSFYLCPGVVKACREKGFHFVSALKSNRNLYKEGKKLKAGAYGKTLIKRNWDGLPLPKGRRRQCIVMPMPGGYMSVNWGRSMWYILERTGSQTSLEL